MMGNGRKSPGDDELSQETEIIVSGSDVEIPVPGKDVDKCHAPRWRPTSKAILSAVEKQILSHVKTPYKGRFVNIGPTVGKKDCEIWTISHTENGSSDKAPVVLVHGFASGVAMWALNLDELAAERPVYAIDLLGFARSSRPNFSSDPQDAEREMVQSIEDWRAKMEIERFVIVGHSMGGFLSSSYALRYPERVSHLVLADPWGFPEKPPGTPERFKNLPLWVKAIGFMIAPFNPLMSIRAAGPWGPSLISRARTDLNDKFSVLNENGEVNISEYIYHCNAQKPSGESAFHSLQQNFGWAKNPIVNRLHTLPKEVPVTFLNGSKSWVEHCPPETLKKKLPESHLEVKLLEGAGHHVYADNRHEFNKLVLEAAAFGDENDRRRGAGSGKAAL